MEKIKIAAYEIPCDSLESDGTLEWKTTTLILISLESEGHVGMGFSYGHLASLDVIKKPFAPILNGASHDEIPHIYDQMLISVRNFGSSGIAANAISAVDVALWDLRSKILGIPLCHLWGMARKEVPVYGSGGFTSYSDKQTDQQFKKWKKQGIKKFKMKVGREPSKDIARVKNARRTLEEKDELFVDANGAYTRKEALDFADKFREYGVTWFEEPVSSDDLEGLNLIRNRAGMNIAAGEYGYNSFYFKRMLESQSVDILQADLTRCCGYTGFFQASALSKAFNIPLSSHTAPSLHLHACLSLSNVCHMEFFHDHVRIEETYFDGFPMLKNGNLMPHLDRLGHGLELKEKDIKKYLIREETL